MFVFRRDIDENKRNHIMHTPARIMTIDDVYGLLGTYAYIIIYC